MESRIEVAIERAVHRVARAMETAAPPLKERHLVEQLRAALGSHLQALETACEVDAGEFHVVLKEWPGVGCVDLVVRSPIGDPLAFLELKWGRDTLYNCVWDLAKMAVAAARGATYKAYLIAGAPKVDWAGGLGSELFETNEWRASDLLERYRLHWEFWRRAVKTRPLLIPDVVATKVVTSEPLEIDGLPWMLRVVEVNASPEDWLDVDSGIRVSRLLTHFTWQPGDVDFLTPEEAARILRSEQD